MNDIKYIIDNCTNNSFVVVDELARSKFVIGTFQSCPVLLAHYGQKFSTLRQWFYLIRGYKILYTCTLASHASAYFKAFIRASEALILYGDAVGWLHMCDTKDSKFNTKPFSHYYLPYDFIEK